MAADKKKRFEKKEATVNRLETGRLSEEDHQEYMKDGRCFRCAKQGHLSRDCPMKNSDKNVEKAVKKTPRDAYVKIQAMFKEYSHDEQKELLDIMEKEGF
uniref:CCHC-type domain-containing protein n=1 Tax=Moniliophthora roreri TaxID=221103 RepID=A0A0W0G1W0_MONRR